MKLKQIECNNFYMFSDLKMQLIRTSIRKNSKIIIDNIIQNHIQLNRAIINNLELCMFCGSTINITKEHVLARWVFNKSTKGFFITDINGLSQTYNRTTIPACSHCNSNLLNGLEKYIQKLFEITFNKQAFPQVQVANIIRWLEIIDYKFQVLNAIRRFKVSRTAGYNSYFADLPLSVLRKSIHYSSSKAIAEIRRSQKRITIKNKAKNINSLITFKTKNQGFHFFHQMDDFIFLELPKQQIALFYFYRRIFDTEISAYEESMKIIKTFY